MPRTMRTGGGENVQSRPVTGIGTVPDKKGFQRSRGVFEFFDAFAYGMCAHQRSGGLSEGACLNLLAECGQLSTLIERDINRYATAANGRPFFDMGIGAGKPFVIWNRRR